MADYNAMFKNDPEKFMRYYSCNPVGRIPGHLGNEDATDFVPTGPTQRDYKYRVMPTADKIAYLNFTKIQQGAGQARTNTLAQHQATGQIFVNGDYTHDPTKVASYFLPWTDEAIISLAIPPMTAHNQGVPVFFTAGINGCSIFIKGTQRSPIVFHAGGATGFNDPDEGAKFWRDLMQSHARTSGANVAEVNKTDYTVDKISEKRAAPLPSGFRPTTVTKYGTAHSRKFETWLKKEIAGNYVVEDVSPTGCVMGLRDNFGDWTFYLQENVTIEYYQFNKVKTGLFGSKKVKIDATKNSVMRPMHFTQFFPGQAHVKFTPKLTRVLKD